MRMRRIFFWVLLVVVVLASAAGIAAYRVVGTFAVAIPDSLKGDEGGLSTSSDSSGTKLVDEARAREHQFGRAAHVEGEMLAALHVNRRLDEEEGVMVLGSRRTDGAAIG